MDCSRTALHLLAAAVQRSQRNEAFVNALKHGILIQHFNFKYPTQNEQAATGDLSRPGLCGSDDTLLITVVSHARGRANLLRHQKNQVQAEREAIRKSEAGDDKIVAPVVHSAGKFVSYEELSPEEWQHILDHPSEREEMGASQGLEVEDVGMKDGLHSQ